MIGRRRALVEGSWSTSGGDVAPSVGPSPFDRHDHVLEFQKRMCTTSREKPLNLYGNVGQQS